MIVGGDPDRGAVGHLDRHLVVEVEGDVQDDLVARRGDREHRVHERHVRAGGDHDARAARHVDPVLRAQLHGQLLDQRRQPGAVLVFVRGGIGQRAADRVERGRWRPVVNHALAQRNGARHLPDEAANDRHNRRLHRVHTRLKSHGLHYIGLAWRPS
jgi:hypothetical protein